MLPLTICQDDLPSLEHTNAEVLTYFLQPRKGTYHVAAQYDGTRMSEIQFLQQLSDHGVRILVDAGALVTEMSNIDLVTKWLEFDTEAQAAIYFGADNQALVKYRKTNKVVALSASPFAENMGGCVVYFDQTHTRGVDLKLPQDGRGALTLTPGQTKDHTTQG